MKKQKKSKKIDTEEAVVAKKRPRLGFLDIAIIFLVIIAILGIYFRFDLIDTLTKNANTQNYVVSFSVKDIRYTTPNYIDVNDSVYFSSTGELFGTLIQESDEMSNIALSVTPASKLFLDNGEFVEVFYPNNESRVDANGRLVCKGVYSADGGLLINSSTHITSGQYISVKTELVSFTMIITNIEVQ